MYKNSILKIFILSTAVFTATAQKSDAPVVYKPFVNQTGYNIGESKRFVCYGAPDGTVFKVLNNTTKQVVFTGKMLNNQGWFSSFNPVCQTNEFVVEVEGRGTSVPFWIAGNLFEKISSKLAYDFFADVRGFNDLEHYDMSKVYGGGPSRDGGAYGLETVFELLQYAANPALYDQWTEELGDKKRADLIDLILWHAEFAYKYFNYNGPVGYRHGTLGYEGQARMNYDYWNTLDQLAAVCAAYHSFLKPYLSEEKYKQYRKVCLDNWENYERHKVVRFWTYSAKWVDQGFQEFNEMGNAYGQSVFSNLFMYLCEKNEPNGNPQKFLNYAKKSAQDIIENWDFNNPRHMWWIRNAEHITPQSLACFLMIAPEEAPKGTREKLEAWGLHMKQKTSNFWKYRMHSESEWAHPKTKELGGAPALAGSLFAVAHVLKDSSLRNLAWSQIDFVFGVNPVGTHLSNKSEERVKIGGYWEGVEEGWPQAHPDGYGRLGLVRGTLDGSPLNDQFPIATKVEKIVGQNNGAVFGKNAYATEGWCISNRGWETSVTFATLHSQSLKLFNEAGTVEIKKAKPGQTVLIQLKAALNQHWDEKDNAWVVLQNSSLKETTKITLKETEANSGVFAGIYKVPENAKGASFFSYGYWGLGVSQMIVVN